MAEYNPTEKIKNFPQNDLDDYGNQVKAVLLKGSCYVIYEIQAADINSRLRVFIDEACDEGACCRRRFDSFKDKYFDAKGLLVEARNFNMMKYRIAATVATCLDTPEVNQQGIQFDPVKVFDALIERIRGWKKTALWNRVFYLIPCVVLTAAAFGYCIFKLDFRTQVESYTCWLILVSWLAASLGSSISILRNAALVDFSGGGTRPQYFFIGVERIFLGYVAAAIAFIAVKSEVILALQNLQQNYWQMMLIIVLAAFSEGFIPSILKKFESRITTKISPAKQPS